MESIALATEIVKKLIRHGYIAYFAGGWVRDFVMKHPSDDIDIATSAPPEVILDLFPRTILVGLNFGVVIVASDGHQFEVSTFRKDIDYRNGRKPERIELATAQEDAIRRDFTINGMFYDPIENLIHDFVGGMEDIKKGVIRSIGDPHERFFEDRLRMIRAFRFSARFNFTIENETQEAIRENAVTLFPAVATERLWQEFKKMSAYPGFNHALVEMHRLDILPVIFPMLKGIHLNDIKHRVAPLARYPEEYPAILFLLELFKGEGLGAILDIGRSLKTSGKDLEMLEFFYKSNQKFIYGDLSKISLADWARFYAHFDSSLVLETAKASMTEDAAKEFLRGHEKRQQELNAYIQRIRLKKPVVSSSDLMKEGIPQGRLLGTLLKEAEEASINHKTENPAIVIEHLKKMPLWPIK